MEREIVGKKPTFRPVKPRYNFFRIMLWISLIIAGVWLLLGLERGQVVSPLSPTPTPTRVAESYIQEAEAYFQAGKLDDPDPPAPAPPHPDAIDTYQRALKLDPTNAQAWAELARIQTYSTKMLSTDAERKTRLQDAQASIDKAIQLNPDDSSIHAIRAFVLDWNASYAVDEQQANMLKDAEREAIRAYQLDPKNGMALAFYAEVLLDLQRWTQAEQYAAQAVNLAPDSMDAHRVYATVLESLGKYNSAIKEYLKAADINPNLTFLYVYVGRNYATLAGSNPKSPNYDHALEFYARAAEIDKQLGIKNPIPNLEIAKTYTQKGEFFIASRNAETALKFDPTNANTYGQLGIIYIKARNYESALPALQCAVIGCTVEENEVATNLVNQGLIQEGVAVQGLPLTNLQVAYYYVEYGTVLAFLSRPNKDYCSQAYQVLNEVRAYSSDPILLSIVEDSEGICRGVASSQNTPAPTPVPVNAGSTPTPGEPSLTPGG
jgi:tetratricopeptide (TPR) repeat protein